MNTWRVILATMVIFGTGVVTGGLLVKNAMPARDHRAQPRPPGAARPGQPSTPAGIARFDFLRRMGRELDLAPEQREPIDKLLKEGQDRMRRINETVEPKRRLELRRTMDEFRQVLTPEQRTRFDQLLRQAQQRQRELHKQAAPHEPGATNATPGASAPGTNG